MYMATLDIADEAEESDPFADIEEDKDELEENKLVLDDCYLYTVYVSLASHTPFTELLYNVSFNTFGGTASIREQRLIESGV